MKPVAARTLLLVGGLCSWAAGPLPVLADEADAKSAAGIDCGLASLYLLFHLEGHPVALTSLAAQLSPLPAEGHSMRDLRDVARRQGLRVTGVLLPPDQPAPHSTSLAFVNRGRHGHFLVLRPVGHTGKLVQVFDGLDGPVVMDWTNLRRSPEWTGLMLLVSPRDAWTRIVWMMVLAGGLAITVLVSQEGRRRRAGQARPVGPTIATPGGAGNRGSEHAGCSPRPADGRSRSRASS